MRKIFIMGGMLLLTLLPLSAQKRVTQLPVDSTYVFGKNYFCYALPQTAFQVNVKVTRSHAYRGVYADYAEKLLGLSNVVKRDEVAYSLKSIQVEQISVPDTNNVFVVEPSCKQVSKGLLTKLSVARAAAGADKSLPQKEMAVARIPDFFRYYADLAYAEKESSYVETQIVDGVVRQVPASKVSKVARSSEQKAQEAADFIAKIREDRYALLAGSQEVPYSAEAISKMVDELNKLEQNYIQLFVGVVVEEEVDYSFPVVPQVPAKGQPSGKQFMFTLADGVCTTASSQRDDENYYLVVNPLKKVQKCTDFQSKTQSSKKYKKQNGYRIRQACAAEVSIYCGSQMIQPLGTLNLYQLGDIEILPLGNDSFEIEKFAFVY